jgi:hypothetical protein
VVAASWPAGEREKGGRPAPCGEATGPRHRQGRDGGGRRSGGAAEVEQGGECGPVRRKKKGKWARPNGIVGFSIYSKEFQKEVT